MKQAEREDTWARVNAQAESVFKDDESMKGFLNFMANCTPQSTRNLLILYEQNTEITHPRTFDKWKEAGRSIRSGEKGYTFFADQEYTKEDGTIANGYTITKAYDISQTRGPQPLPPQQHLPEEIIATMVENSPVPLAISDQLPQGVQAQYVPKQRTIFVRNGMDETATICAIAREQAHASFDMVGTGRRMRPKPTARPMWRRRNSAWIPPPFISTRCAKAMRKGARTISAAFWATSNGPPMPSTGTSKGASGIWSRPSSRMSSPSQRPSPPRLPNPRRRKSRNDEG